MQKASNDLLANPTRPVPNDYQHMLESIHALGYAVSEHHPVIHISWDSSVAQD